MCHSLCTTGKGNSANMRWARINISDGDQINEISEYISCRDLGAAEAFWRILQFNSKWREPSVETIPVHLPGSDQIRYDDGDGDDPIAQQQAIEAALFGQSKLMRYLNRPKILPFKAQRYAEYWAQNRIVPRNTCSVPKYAVGTEALDYTPNAALQGIARCWVWPRRDDRHYARLPLIWPSAGEVYYLRALLLNMAPMCWEDLLANPQNPAEPFTSYNEAAHARGLFEADGEQDSTFKEAVNLMYTPKQLRNLFVWTLHEGGNGPELWRYCEKDVLQGTTQVNPLSEDFQGSTLQKQNELLKDIRDRLVMLNKTLAQYGLPEPTDDTNIINR